LPLLPEQKMNAINNIIMYQTKSETKESSSADQKEHYKAMKWN